MVTFTLRSLFPSSTYWLGGWVSHAAGLDVKEKKKNNVSFPETESHNQLLRVVIGLPT
jgi:hypothetical protein